MDLYAITSQEVLDRISRHCPGALSTYLQCINRANAEGVIFFDKKMVTNDMSESWAKFKNSVKKLSLENLLEWHLFNGGISVTLVAQDEDE